MSSQTPRPSVRFCPLLVWLHENGMLMWIHIKPSKKDLIYLLYKLSTTELVISLMAVEGSKFKESENLTDINTCFILGRKYMISIGLG